MITIVLDELYKKSNGKWSYGDKNTIKLNDSVIAKDVVATIYQDFINDGYISRWHTLDDVMKFNYKSIMIQLIKADRQCDMYIMFN